MWEWLRIIEKWKLLPPEVYVQINIGHEQKVGACNSSLHHGLLKVTIANNELLLQWCQVALGWPVLSMYLCTLQTLEDTSSKHIWCFERPLFSLTTQKNNILCSPFLLFPCCFPLQSSQVEHMPEEWPGVCQLSTLISTDFLRTGSDRSFCQLHVCSTWKLA